LPAAMLGSDLSRCPPQNPTSSGGDMTDQEDRVPCQRCAQRGSMSELQGGRCPRRVANRGCPGVC
jgi:hypothetical protein